MKNRKLAIVVGLMGVMSVSLVAKPIYNEVKAIFNPTIQYVLDGEEVLQGKGALVYKDKIYLPIRDAANVLGVDVDYQNKTVILTKPKEEAIQEPEIEIQEPVEIEEPIVEIEQSRQVFSGEVKDIDLENNIIHVVYENSNEVLLSVNDAQFFGKHGEITDKMIYRLEDVKIGMMIDGLKSEIDALSFPARSSASLINIHLE